MYSLLLTGVSNSMEIKKSSIVTDIGHFGRLMVFHFAQKTLQTRCIIMRRDEKFAKTTTLTRFSTLYCIFFVSKTDQGHSVAVFINMNNYFFYHNKQNYRSFFSRF